MMASAFDAIRTLWKKESLHKRASIGLILTFLSTLALIEASRQGLLPGEMAALVGQSHYMAINLAFSLVLILEVISLIFTLPASMSRALGKQFEILALIFIRNCFKNLSDLPEPIEITGHTDVLWHILSYGCGAVVIFALLGVYLSLLKKLDEALSKGPSLDRFIKAKKGVSLMMLIIFIIMGAANLTLQIKGEAGFHFFQYFYTVLIFSDILLVLIAQAFLPQFPAVFRNSGYAVATLMIRLSLTAPTNYDVGIGIFAVLFAMGLTLVYNRFYTIRREPGETP